MILKSDETLKDAILTANSADIQYPVTNILDSRLSRLFRTSSSTTAEIVFDAESAVTVTSVCIAAHNITSSVTTLKFQGNATDVWTSPSVDETLTWDADIITKDFTGGSYRYWRIQIIDGTNPDGYIELGRATGYKAFTTPGIAPTVSQVQIDSSTKTRTPSQQTYGDLRKKYFTFTIKWNAFTQAEKAEIQDFFDTIGIATPFFVTFNEDCLDLTTYYVSIDGDEMRYTLLQNPDYYTASLDLIEEK